MNQHSNGLLGSLLPHRQRAEVWPPAIAPLSDPPSLVSPPRSSVLMRGHCVVAASRYDRLSPSLHQQRSHGVTVRAAVTSQPLRRPSRALTRCDAHVGTRGFPQCHRRRGSLLQVSSARRTRASGQYHKAVCPGRWSSARPAAPCFRASEHAVYAARLPADVLPVRTLVQASAPEIEQDCACSPRFQTAVDGTLCAVSCWQCAPGSSGP